MDMENLFFKNYDETISVDTTMLIVAAWNMIEGEVKISLNDKDYFEDMFESSYDAAWAASAGDYQWTDDYVYVSDEGYLTSFTQLDDDTCPIDIDKIDINSLIKRLQGLQELQNQEDKKGYVNNISRAIQDALQEV